MKCKTCGAAKAPADFYASNKSRCKDCVKSSVKAHRAANLERVRQYDRMRASQPHRVVARSEYQKTRAFAESHEAAAKRWSAKHPERKRAQTAVSNAVRDGRLLRWPVCEVPDCCGNPEAHHPDYSMPLVVTWLCGKHHKEAHRLVKDLAEP